MIHVAIDGYNSLPNAPKGWLPPPSGEPCDYTVVRAVAMGMKGQRCETAWKPTPEELALLNAGGVIVLSLQSWQVPLTLSVVPAEQADAA